MQATALEQAPEGAPRRPKLALVMTGGGARAAYQAGLLAGLCRRMPDLAFPILTGVSAGAINAAFLAQAEGDWRERTRRLCELWLSIGVGDVIETGGLSLSRLVAGWGARLLTAGRVRSRSRQGLVDTTPLIGTLARALRADERGHLTGIARNLASGQLEAVAVTGTNYDTGCSVTWVQGTLIENWERRQRLSVPGPLMLSQVLASAALPLLFPPVRLMGSWFGDGGIALTAPLSPAVHLGAERILAVSTRFVQSRGCLDPTPGDDPPPAQVAGALLNAVFLDSLDQDALNLARINDLLARLGPARPANLRPVNVAVVRPSRDLGRLANDYEARLPPGLRFLTRGWGTRETRSNDLLSLLMFQPDYLSRLVELGERDAETLGRELEHYLRAPLLVPSGGA
jgi:NTE family protein